MDIVFYIVLSYQILLEAMLSLWHAVSVTLSVHNVNVFLSIGVI